MVIKSVGYLSLIFGMMLPVTASLATIPSPVKNRVNFPLQISLEFPPAPKGEPPVSTAGGGTRGITGITSNKCGIENGSNSTMLTALVPSQNTLTVSANPTFFVYVPQLNESQILKGDFSIIESQSKRDVYFTPIKLPKKPSIVRIELPETVTLETEIPYTWTFSITCDTPDTGTTEEDSVSVNIQRNELTPTLKSELEKNQDPLKKAAIYAREKIWQDTLMMMVQLRDSQQEEWKSLLKSIKIEESIIEAPFAPEPTVINSEEQSAQ